MTPEVTVRRRTLAVAATTLVVAAALVGGSASWAATQVFSDVPSNHPFADEIAWMHATGISTGYQDGTYRPNDPVTRQAMSAFLQRTYNLRDDVGVSTSTSDIPVPTTAYTTVATTTITVPEGTTADLLATFSGASTCTSANTISSYSCMIELRVEGTTMSPGEMVFEFSGKGQDDGYESHSVQGAITDVDPGTYTVSALARRGSGEINGYSIYQPTLVAQAVLRPTG